MRVGRIRDSGTHRGGAGSSAVVPAVEMRWRMNEKGYSGNKVGEVFALALRAGYGLAETHGNWSGADTSIVKQISTSNAQQHRRELRDKTISLQASCPDYRTRSMCGRGFEDTSESVLNRCLASENQEGV